nr:hypothetical protein [Tanacetum cinerariifolium]
TPFFKTFLVTADVLEIYMQELWATATVHHHSIRHNGAIRRLNDVNINKFHQPWRSFAAIINKCLSRKSSGYDSLRLSQAQFLWRFYHKRNVDLAYLLREDFVYQVEHKDTRKSNEMYYPRFTKVITHYFLSTDPLIPRRNKVNWHYVRDDQMFTTIKLVSRHQNTQQFGAMFPIKLTNADIRNSEAYKEYYAVAMGAIPPKTKASVRKTKSSFDTTVTPPLTTAAGTRLFTSVKGKQPATTSEAKSLTALSEVAMTEAEQLKLATKRSLQYLPSKCNEQDDDDDQEEGNDDDQDSDEEGKEFIHPRISAHDEKETRDEESFDPIPKTPENMDDEGNGEENLGLNVGREEGLDEEDDKDELYRDVNINLKGRGSSFVSSQFVTSMLNPTPDVGIESIFETTSQMDVQAPTSVAPLPLSPPTLTPSTIATIATVQQAPTPPKTTPSTLLQNLPNCGSLFGFDHRLKTLEDNFSEFVQTNQFAGASDRLRDEAQAENEEFLKTIDENKQKIIKEQVKEQVKVQVSKILPKIKQTMNEQLEAEILIEKMEGNKSIYRSNEQMNLYNALVEAYESNKIILDTYEDTVTLKKHRDDDVDKDQEPFAGSDWGSKRRREGKEPESTKAADYGHIKWIEDLVPQTMWIHEPVGYDKHALWRISHWGRKRQQFYRFAVNRESARDVYSKRKIIAVTELKIVEWHNYKHLDWITVRRDDDKLYKFKEGDFKRIHNVYKKHRNPKACGRPSTQCQKLPEEAQPHKAGYVLDGTLTDVRTALDDRLKRIRMKCLPQTIWRKSDKERVTPMIQAIDKQLKTKRIMRSLERFVGRRLYEGDFRMLHRTI